jgi:predicted Fe-Mo cluster-binding NifX family protein
VKLIAFSTSGTELDAELDPRFGRARGFLLYDLELQQVRLLENEQSRNAAQGAGIHAAEAIVRAGVDTLVTGHCGPKAFRVLDAAGVQVYNCPVIPLQEALQALQGGILQAATAADVEGHW